MDDNSSVWSAISDKNSSAISPKIQFQSKVRQTVQNDWQLRNGKLQTFSSDLFFWSLEIKFSSWKKSLHVFFFLRFKVAMPADDYVMDYGACFFSQGTVIKLSSQSSVWLLSRALQEYQVLYRHHFLDRFLPKLRSGLAICCPANPFGLRATCKPVDCNVNVPQLSSSDYVSSV